MSEVKMISPLLDDMIVENERVGHNGQICHTLRNQKNGEQFILKTISLPETDSRIRALILSGAYPDEQAVHTYYSRLAEDMKAELQVGQNLASSGNFAGAVSFQIEPKKNGVGYDIYILYPMSIPLNEFLSMNAMTRLRALNLGIDLCDSIIACREAGYLFQNICPESIFLMRSDKFLLGGLGLTALEYLQYAGVPEEYLGTYSAPELSDIMASPNLTIDLYALGMVLYRIYNGNHDPFEDESTNAAMAEKLRLSGKPLPSPIFADYELAEIILKACSFKQEDRYQSPEELKQALMLYMQRNEVSDELIAPPIVADLEPITAEDEDSEVEPIRMTDAKDLDENFRQNFAPNMASGGEDTISEEADDTDVTEEVQEEVIDETPVQEEAPAAEIPVVAEDPIAEEPPVEEELPISEDAPAEEEPVAEEPVEETEEDIVVAENDDDQMDLDTLLASVNAVVGDAPTEAEENELAESEDTNAQEPSTPKVKHDYVDAAHDDSEDSDDEEEAKPAKRPKIILWSTIAAILCAIALGAYFLLNWYFVDVTELKVVYTTPTQIMVELVTNDNPEYFKVTCTDAYGNVHESLRSDKQYCFTDLRENTTYTITVSATQTHKFPVAAPSLTQTTNAYTSVKNITVERTNVDGEVEFNCEFDGPVADYWNVSYYIKGNSDNMSDKNFSADDLPFTIDGLSLYETYVFTVTDAGGVFMTEAGVAEYTVYPNINAENFTLDSIEENTVTLRWDYNGATPLKWAVVCMADGMENISVSTEETTAKFTLTDFTKEYRFYLSAIGMDEPKEFVLEANPIIINNFAANTNNSGEIVITWDTPGGEPEGGWQLVYRLNDVYYESNGWTVTSPAEDENRIVLKNCPANAHYIIELVPLTTQPVLSGELKLDLHTANAEPFVDYQVLPTAPYGDGTNLQSLIALWKEPEQPKWDYRDLNSARRVTYTADERIAFCVQIDSCDLSAAVQNDEVCLTYAVRNANGDIVACEIIQHTDEAKTVPLTWPAVWFDRRHTGTIPIPFSATEVDENGKPVVLAGKFTFELYINGKILATKGFTIEG